MIDLLKLKAENPLMSPAELFDLACKQEGIACSWATVPWTAAANWMDMLANAPSSCTSH